MKILIDIPNELYDAIPKTLFRLNGRASGKTFVSDLIAIILGGTPIPDNATVGEVFCMLACKEPICETASYFTIDKKLWNAPYQKGGK